MIITIYIGTFCLYFYPNWHLEFFLVSKNYSDQLMEGDFPDGSSGKKICLPMQETWVQSLGQEESLEKETATLFSILAWNTCHGQRSLVDYSPRGCKELDTTEHTQWWRGGGTPIEIYSAKKSSELWFHLVPMVKNLPAMRDTGVQSLGWEDPL